MKNGVSLRLRLNKRDQVPNLLIRIKKSVFDTSPDCNLITIDYFLPIFKLNDQGSGRAKNIRHAPMNVKLLRKRENCPARAAVSSTFQKSCITTATATKKTIKMYEPIFG